MKNDITFLQFIKDLRKHPGMYLGTESITRLHLFIPGWRFGKENIPEINTLDDFSKWVKLKYGFSEQDPHSWANIILFYSLDEADALNLFFKLFDEFLAQL